MYDGGSDHERTEMTPILKHRIAKQLWYLCVQQKNPWFTAAASQLEGYRGRWDAWNTEQIEVTRALCAVVFDGSEVSEDLLKRAVDFIERVT